MEDLQRIKKLSGLRISEEATDAEIQDKGSLDGSPGTGISVDDMIISMVTDESNERSEEVFVYVDAQFGTQSYQAFAGDRETPDEPAGYDMDLADFKVTKVLDDSQQIYNPSEKEMFDINMHLKEFLSSEYVQDLIRQEMSYYN